jgi:hypothetical protein
LPDIFLPADVTAGRLEDRRLLLARFERGLGAAERSPAMADLDGYYEQAFREYYTRYLYICQYLDSAFWMSRPRSQVRAYPRQSRSWRDGKRYAAVGSRLAIIRDADILMHTRIVNCGERVGRGEDRGDDEPAWWALRHEVLKDASLWSIFLSGTASLKSLSLAGMLRHVGER